MKRVLSLILLAILVATPMFAGEKKEDGTFGRKTVMQLWKMLAEGDVGSLDKLMADGFQSVHQDGARDKRGELDLIKDLDIKNYKLDDFKTTRSGDIYIVTYTVAVAENIDGKELKKTKAERMSLFLKTDEGWQWLAHANLNPIKQ